VPALLPNGFEFLNKALGAAYTPIPLDPSGRVFALDNGELTVLGR
jgi:hypothetical protein